MFLLRRKIWNIIEKNRENSSEQQYCDTPRKQIKQEIETRSPFSDGTSSSSSSPSTSSRSDSPVSIDLTGCNGFVKPQASPAFFIYSDGEIVHASQTNALSDELINRLVRNTISNMRSACQKLANPREPTTLEMEDMARALCRKYPCLGRVCSDDGKSYVTVASGELPKLMQDQRNQLHHFLLNKLKKRFRNVAPVKKRQGKVPARAYKRCKVDIPEHAVDPEEKSPIDMVTNACSTGTETNKGIINRHYSALAKEQSKSKPNESVIQKYLNLDFASRREMIKETNTESRPSKIFQQYPCFKDANEVVEEVRRILNLPEEKTPACFMGKCVKTLESKLDGLTYYGISKGALQPPRGSSVDHKMMNLMKGINQIFKSKKAKLKTDIVHIIEDDGEPSQWQSKRGSCVPGLILTKNSGAMVLVGKEILLKFTGGETTKAVIAFISCFYLLDVDYPPSWLVSMSVLHNIIFGDRNVHPDHQSDVTKALEDFKLFTEQ